MDHFALGTEIWSENQFSVDVYVIIDSWARNHENSSLISDQSVIKSLQTIHVSNFCLI